MTMKFMRWHSVGSENHSRNTMDLNQEQEKTLEEFKKRVKHLTPPHLQPDHELVRWLIARSFDIDRAESMLLKSLEWRKSYDVDNILNYEPPEVIRKYNPLGFTGYDKEGYPVWIVPYGCADVKGLLQSTSQEQFVKIIIQTIEKGPQVVSPKSAHLRKVPDSKQVVLFDLANFSLRHFTWKPAIDAIIEITKIYEANYPEMLKKGYVINAPVLFQVLYTAVKPFMAQETTEKIQIFGTTGWQEVLLQDISADQLPAHYGGTLTDPDGNPKCLSMISWGGEVPKSYYKKRYSTQTSSDDTLKGFESLVVPSHSKRTLDFKVEDVGSSLCWEFKIEDFDIGFGISRLGTGSEEVLIPVERVTSQDTIEGTLYCSKTGTYQVTFDNEYSYVRSKNLKYKITIVPPRDDATKL